MRAEECGWLISHVNTEGPQGSLPVLLEASDESLDELGVRGCENPRPKRAPPVAPGRDLYQA